LTVTYTEKAVVDIVDDRLSQRTNPTAAAQLMPASRDASNVWSALEVTARRAPPDRRVPKASHSLPGT
jgi:hypothetical protein